MGADQGDLLVGDGDGGSSVSVRLDVSEITNVSLRSVGGTVVLSVRVEVGTSGSATVRVVTELVDVESSLGVSVKVLDGTSDGDGSTLGLLGEGDDTLDGGVTLENSNSLSEGIGRSAKIKGRSVP